MEHILILWCQSKYLFVVGKYVLKAVSQLSLGRKMNSLGILEISLAIKEKGKSYMFIKFMLGLTFDKSYWIRLNSIFNFENLCELFNI